MADEKSKVTYYRNTPFTKLNEPILFESKADREDFLNRFLNSHTFANVNSVRDRFKLRVNMTFTEACKINLIKMDGGLDDNEPNFYFQVSLVEYVNKNTQIIHYLPDLLLTYCYGTRVQDNAKNVLVEREHLTGTAFSLRQKKLATNNDLLYASSHQVRAKEFHNFSRSVVFFNSSADLTKAFGTEDNSQYKASSGAEYDNVITPLDLYMVNLQNWKDLTKYLSDYSWIAQTITNIALIPQEMIDFDDFEQVNINKDHTVQSLKRCKNGGHSSNTYFDDLKKSMSDIALIGGLTPTSWTSKILNREEYIKIRVSLNTGDYLDLNPALLPEKGIDLIVQSVFGVTNEIALYQSEYNSATAQGNLPKGIDTGLQYENAIFFSNWSQVSTIINPSNLNLGMNSNRRAYEQSNLISGQIKRMGDSNNDPQDRLMAGLQGLGDTAGSVMGAGSLLGAGTAIATSGLNKVNKDYEYYRSLSATKADMALQPQQISPVRSGVNFGMANGTWGVQVEYIAINSTEANSLKVYHNKMGVEVKEYKDLASLYSMNNVNYAKFTGNWFIDDVPSEYMQIIRALYEEGVTHYHKDYALSFPDMIPQSHFLLVNEPK